jgi:hypothetical protein
MSGKLLQLSAGRVAVVAVLASLLASCGGGGGEAAGAELAIESPSPEQEVTSPVRFELSIPGVQIGSPEEGLMHFHVYVDGSDEFQVLPSTEGEVSLPQGQHTITIVLAQPNHDETDTRASVVVNVTGGAQGAESATGSGYTRGGYGN